LDRTVTTFLESQADYASNNLVRTYPLGLDVEVVAGTSLEQAWHEAKEGYERVHVTPFFYRNPDRFRCVNVAAEKDYSNCRWTVDTSADLEFVRAVYARMKSSEPFRWLDVIAMLKREPNLNEINCGVLQKTLEEG
jgi:spore coat polysaccharide biosynthesis protein SpsF